MMSDNKVGKNIMKALLSTTLSHSDRGSRSVSSLDGGWVNGLKYTLPVGTGKGFPDTCASLSTDWGSIICTCQYIMFKNDSMVQM